MLTLEMLLFFFSWQEWELGREGQRPARAVFARPRLTRVPSSVFQLGLDLLVTFLGPLPSHVLIWSVWELHALATKISPWLGYKIGPLSPPPQRQC